MLSFCPLKKLDQGQVQFSEMTRFGGKYQNLQTPPAHFYSSSEILTFKNCDFKKVGDCQEYNVTITLLMTIVTIYKGPPHSLALLL